MTAMTLPQPLTIAIEQGSRVHSELREAMNRPLDLTCASPNVKIGAALCRLAVNHGRGISLLMKEVIPGPAAALLRPQREVLLRAVWTSKLATEAQLALFADWEDLRTNVEPDFPKMHEIMEAMQTREELESIRVSLAAIQDLFRRHMHSHPHGGLRAIQQVMGGGFDWLLAVNYLKASAAQSFLAARHAAEILDDAVMRRSIRTIDVWPDDWLRTQGSRNAE